MTVTWRDAVATVVTGALVVGYVGLAQGAGWAPVTSVRWYSLVFLVAGQAACVVGAADAMAAGVVKGPGLVLGPLAALATVAALATGMLSLLTVAVAATVGLWVLTTSRHMLVGHRAVRS